MTSSAEAQRLRRALEQIQQYQPAHDDIPTGDCEHGGQWLMGVCLECYRHRGQLAEQNRQADERAADVLRGIARRALGITA